MLQSEKRCGFLEESDRSTLFLLECVENGSFTRLEVQHKISKIMV
jgi:hypothetical protein